MWKAILETLKRLPQSRKFWITLITMIKLSHDGATTSDPDVQKFIAGAGALLAAALVGSIAYEDAHRAHPGMTTETDLRVLSIESSAAPKTKRTAK